MALESSPQPRRKPREERVLQGTKVPISTYLDGDLYDRLVALADQNERPVAAEIRLAVRHHLDQAATA